MEEVMMSPDLEVMAGPFLLLLALSLILFGVLSCQMYFYWTTYLADSPWMRNYVLGVWLLECVHTALWLHAMYIYFARSLINAGAGLYTITWSTAAAVLLSHLIVIITQGFYIYRIWQLSDGCWVITAIPAFLLTAKFGLSLASCQFFFRFGTWEALRGDQTAIAVFDSAISVCVATDLVTTAIFSYYLKQNRLDFGRTRHVIDKLLRYTVHTSAVTFVVSASILITFYAWEHSLAFIGIIAVISKVYCTTMLAMLNARREIRDKLEEAFMNSIHLSSINIEHLV
ncbi:hypothetical protein PsYK624_005590 [Phanerochaete sordida]|uniref:DUF6534 domain-containing protein n=1 Tax=Phanerochaete sordida TaxID=48140 RepID=A0A9P3FWQ0_9APHY|nr:hypothetical protein PsYK624_005590 [Phanerochaete sordida]